MNGGTFLLVILLPLLCLLAIYILRERVCGCLRDSMVIVQTKWRNLFSHASMMYANMRRTPKSEENELHFINKRSVYTQSGTGEFSLLNQHVYIDIEDNHVYTEAYEMPTCTPPSSLPPSFPSSDMYLTSFASYIASDHFDGVDEGNGEGHSQGHVRNKGEGHVTKKGHGQLREDRKEHMVDDGKGHLCGQDQGQPIGRPNPTFSTSQYVSHDNLLKYNKGLVTSLGVGKSGQHIVQLHATPAGRLLDGASPDSDPEEKGQHEELERNERIISECSTKERAKDVGDCETVNSCSQTSPPSKVAGTLKYVCPNCGNAEDISKRKKVLSSTRSCAT
ncbi:uncharacterized protein LOC124134519 [Haliotis rufescens]|uniref:uncharacterized protein LOC124134519 n=1 Tax=Haliotis rufescens TaxID=6454 RepID=UPI00201F3AAA|nr:uncharacterized protein LOC124134519 [Haliotis rufescens]